MDIDLKINNLKHELKTINYKKDEKEKAIRKIENQLENKSLDDITIELGEIRERESHIANEFFLQQSLEIMIKQYKKLEIEYFTLKKQIDILEKPYIRIGFKEDILKEFKGKTNKVCFTKSPNNQFKWFKNEVIQQGELFPSNEELYKEGIILSTYKTNYGKPYKPKAYEGYYSQDENISKKHFNDK
jgi:hypothetical protein